MTAPAPLDHETKPDLPERSLMLAPPSRREVLLFGLLLLALVWLLIGRREHTVVVIPDTRTSAGIIT
jgi:hypothetical protein